MTQRDLLDDVARSVALAMARNGGVLPADMAMALPVPDYVPALMDREWWLNDVSLADMVGTA